MVMGRRFNFTSWACVLLITLLAPCAMAARADKALTTQPSADADTAALHAIWDTYERALRENNPDLLAPLLDAQFTGVTVAGDRVDSPQSLAEYWRKLRQLIGEQASHDVRVTMDEPITITGDLALMRGSMQEEVTRGSSKPLRYESQWTAVARKHDGQWKLLRLHSSMPAVDNPFVQALLDRTGLHTSLGAVVVGLGLGWAAHTVWSMIKWRRQARREGRR
ncbi:MAG: nuclear transport factor 2 family protein [Phycisphaeraceae bacterium]